MTVSKIEDENIFRFTLLYLSRLTRTVFHEHLLERHLTLCNNFNVFIFFEYSVKYEQINTFMMTKKKKNASNLIDF